MLPVYLIASSLKRPISQPDPHQKGNLHEKNEPRRKEHDPAAVLCRSDDRNLDGDRHGRLPQGFEGRAHRQICPDKRKGAGTGGGKCHG